jgi:hypothetical protein
VESAVRNGRRREIIRSEGKKEHPAAIFFYNFRFPPHNIKRMESFLPSNESFIFVANFSVCVHCAFGREEIIATGTSLEKRKTL